MPLISVIVPVYNTEKYLRRCIDSILTQTFSDFEILLVDDGSTDSSGAICDEYAKKDQRVRVFHKENGGVSSARNLGLDKAKGEWIAFVDSDDEIKEESLEKGCIDSCAEDLIIGVIRDCTNEIQQGFPAGCYSQIEWKKLYANNIGHLAWGSVWGKLFKSSLIGDVRFDTNMFLGEDELFLLQILLRVRTCRSVTSFLYMYWPPANSDDFYCRHVLSIKKAIYSLTSLCRAYDKLSIGSDSFKIMKFMDYKRACQKSINENPRLWYKNEEVLSIYKTIKKKLSFEYRIRYGFMFYYLYARRKKSKDVEHISLRNGLSGLMRTRNEASLISKCIDSCINALDELIVVYNDCTDNTEEILKAKCKQYPDKLRIFAYNHKVLSYDLTKDEYQYAKTLPDDSPRLYCNQCNFGVSKMRYKYAVKIDADQIYFEDEIKKWRDVCAGVPVKKNNMKCFLGWLFMMYLTLYRRLSAKANCPLIAMLPTWLVSLASSSYLYYAKLRLNQGSACIALSGVNLFKDGEWYIPFDRYNIHPPYNGSGDTVIFKISDETYYTKRYSDVRTYSVTDQFHCPYKMMFAGPVWFHLHANRSYCFEKVKLVRNSHPELFVSPSNFVNMNYKQVLNMMDPEVNTLYERILFALIHKMGMPIVRSHLNLLGCIKF